MSHLKDPTTQYYTGEYPNRNNQRQASRRSDTGTGLRKKPYLVTVA
ncbi:hypothetical protein ACLB1N_29705 [Escherichia coli]